MKRYTFCILLAATLACQSAFASSYILDDEFRVPPPDGAIAADPIVDADGSLAGFVYILPDSQSFDIDQSLKSGIAVVSPVTEGGKISKTVNYVRGDTLYIYALLLPPSDDSYVYGYPSISRIEVQAAGLSSSEVTPKYNSPPSGAYLSAINHAELNLVYGFNGSPIGIVVSCRFMYSRFSETLGPEMMSASTSILLSLDLSQEFFRDGSSLLSLGYLTDSTALDMCGLTSYYNSWDFRDFPGDSNYGWSSSLGARVLDNGSSVIASQTTQGASGGNLLVGNFLEDAGKCDELVFVGNSMDLLNLHGTSASGHVACYSFHGGIAQEVWYRPITPNLKFYFGRGNIITELRQGMQVAHLNAANGQFDEVHTFQAPGLGFTRFFVTDPNGSTLNMLSLRNDTMRVYRYDIATDVDEPGVAPVLPRSYRLNQNYPNPFNGETVISFELDRADELTLDIYNVSGQKMTTLVSGRFSAGSHQVTWKPDEKIASGVYFAKLRGSEGAATINLQYVK